MRQAWQNYSGRERVNAHEYSFTVLFEPAEEGGHVVTCPALPGLVSEGDTLDEARENAKDGAQLPSDKEIRLDPVKEKVIVALASP